MVRVPFHKIDQNIQIFFFRIRHIILKFNLKAGNTIIGGRLSTVDLLIKVACFVKNVNNIFNIKEADLNLLIQGGQL